MQLSSILNLSLWTPAIDISSVISAFESEWNDYITEEIYFLREIVPTLVMHLIFFIKSHPYTGISS